MSNERILVVDDEPGVRSALEAVLGDEGFDVVSVGSGEDGVAAVEQGRYDAILLDVWLPGIDGLETLTRIRERTRSTEVVMISGHGTIETAVRATKLGAFDFVEKPLSLEKTLLVLRNALRQRRLERANRRLMTQLSRDTEIVGSSESARGLRTEIELALGSNAPVLILGRQGSGRENVARRLHMTGRRSDAPFVEIPCGALEAPAAERALWGHGKDPGRIALARGGTLFLEDVGRLDRAVQQRLAATLTDRAREDEAPRPMASAAPEESDLDPELAPCLDVLRIVVPSLRERREDIPLLAERTMRELSREYGRTPRRLAPATLAALQGHDWPGEIRELRNLIERLLLHASGEVVEVEDLPESMGGSGGRFAVDLYGDFASLADAVSAFERYYIRRAVAQAENLQAAARSLGIDLEELEGRVVTGH